MHLIMSSNTIENDLSYLLSNLCLNHFKRIYKDVYSTSTKDKIIKKHKKIKKIKIVDKEPKIKEKRKLSTYNIFIKEKMKNLNNSGIYSRDKMKYVAKLWNDFKNSQKKVQLKNEGKDEDINHSLNIYDDYVNVHDYEHVYDNHNECDYDPEINLLL